jgi:signal transduction histidine kinase
VRAIELRLNAVERRANLQLDVRLDQLADSSPSQEVDLYHIAVEALNNVVKHAATRVTLRLIQTDGWVHLRIVDDGQGFDPRPTKGGMGLRNIRERVARLDGQLTTPASRAAAPAALNRILPHSALR